METVILIMAGVFAVVMIILLPKYAKFIHNQPKMQIEKTRQQQENPDNTKNSQSPEKDG